LSQPNSSPIQSEAGDARDALGYFDRALFEALIEQLPVNLHFKDREGRFLLASLNAAERLGAPDLASLIGLHDRDFFDPVHANKASADEQLLLNGQVDVVDCTEQEVWPDGRTAWVATVKLPLRDQDGSIIGTFGASMDVTAQKQAEQELVVARNEAEAFAKELEAALEELIGTQDQLLQAQKLEAVGQLAAGVAHEINTPIQYVNDNTQFIADSLRDLTEVYNAAEAAIEAARVDGFGGAELERFDELSYKSDFHELLEDMPDAAEETLEGGTRIAEIVRALKAFARPSSDEMKPVDLNEVVTTTVLVSRNEWKYVSEVETNLANSLPMVQGHAGHLNQALLLLIVNSAQAIERHCNGEEKGIISIGTRASDQYVELWVEDNGGGIPTQIADRVFEPFFTTKDVEARSGQGLTLVHNIVVKGHNGSVTYDSEPGIGTTFRIRLPLAETK
jgi:PAS domain S-box-containing protein